MSEHDALIGSYTHLPNLPRAPDALLMLRKIASLVKPIMRKRGWRVGTLAEFIPDQDNLLGVNYNKGQRICLRLRHVRDQTLFRDLEELTDTMLHELSHIVHGPHDAKFHALWNELRDAYIDLKMKGYSGEGFLSNGKRLGGRAIPIQEMRRQARLQAEKRRTLQAGSGQKLGGAPVLRGTDMRAVIASAVERRNKITQGCGSGNKDADAASEQAANNGFRTKAEEDDANDRAISQALWELMQDEEDRKAGVESELWIRRDPPTDSSWTPETGIQGPSRRPQQGGPKTEARSTPGPSRSAPPIPNHSKPLPRSKLARTDREWNVLRPRANAPLLSAEELRIRHGSGTNTPQVDLTSSSDGEEDGRPHTPIQHHLQQQPAVSVPPPTWTCEICTLVNPINYLMCDACGVERPSLAVSDTPEVGSGMKVEQNNTSTRSTARGPPLVTSRVVQEKVVERPKPIGWNCMRCGSFMESQWWTCSACGLMKASS